MSHLRSSRQPTTLGARYATHVRLNFLVHPDFRINVRGHGDWNADGAGEGEGRRREAPAPDGGSGAQTPLKQNYLRFPYLCDSEGLPASQLGT